MSSTVLISKAGQTKIKILEALVAAVDDLTVKQICEKSGVSRQTFYYHFYSKYDIAYWLLDFGYDLYLREIGKTISWEVAFQNFFEFLYDYKDYLRYAFASNPTVIDVEPRLEQIVNEVKEIIREKGISIDRALEYCINYYVKAGNRVIVEWCQSAMEDKPEDFVRYFEACMPSRVVRILRTT